MGWDWGHRSTNERVESESHHLEPTEWAGLSNIGGGTRWSTSCVGFKK